jgi:hypothetical protein
MNIMTKFMRKLQRVTGSLLTVIAVIDQVGVVLICVFLILRGPSFVVQFLA